MVHSLYLLTGQDETYRTLIEGYQIPELRFTQQRQEATIVLAAPPLAAKVIDDFPALRWLQSTFAGVDSLIQSSGRQDYQLTNVKGIFGQAITEYVLGYMIAHYRHFNRYRQQQQQQSWLPHPYERLTGKTMVILGTGNIATFLALAARHMGLIVIGVNRTGKQPEPCPFDDVYAIRDIEKALAMADVVVNTLPNTPATESLLDLDMLNNCRQALLFNVGRGLTLKEADLIAAIEAGSIQHAFLDVFVTEPLPSSHPFWLHPQITLTPHIAAISFPEQIVDIFIDNLRLWIQGKPLNYVINFNKGY
ncbi:D-2-hydroxyacid dehydrogenase [Vibrio sp. MEBiC08052]|uniref:D-2-hydroxyacid dehydrogenase n=1 Tax=Vibrio sp. MEBiC08052 TaxID=1761910 RepID=UPI000740612F|nr:D-2-hydroxyacid dehydrogenase [Vibrio sp. MEBiC08052]KUJ00653.1 aspartate-semialdehyde dehydrogenase [Vibrio sp. MEBiC08052]